MDMCRGNIWNTLKSLVDVSSCVFGEEPSAIETLNEPSPPNECPREV